MHKDEHILFVFLISIIRVIKPWSRRLAGHAASMGEKGDTCRI